MCGFGAEGNSFAPAVDQAAMSEAFVATTTRYCDTAFADPLTSEQRQRYGMDQIAEALGGGPDPAAAEDIATAPSMSIGERFNVMGYDFTAMAGVAVTAVVVDPDCSGAEQYTSTAPVAQNGHFVAVQMDVATTAEYDANLFSYPTGARLHCHRRRRLHRRPALRLGPVHRRSRSLLHPDGARQQVPRLDLAGLPRATGTLTFRPHFAPSSYPGVVIELPASGSAAAPAEDEVTEDSEDFAQWRDNIAANDGEPSSSAESHYLYACEQGTLPPADCP